MRQGLQDVLAMGFSPDGTPLGMPQGMPPQGMQMNDNKPSGSAPNLGSAMQSMQTQKGGGKTRELKNAKESA